MRRSVVGLGLFVIAACSTAKHDEPASTGTTRQDLVAYDSDGDPAQVEYKGDDLGDHELALTFDDGPGTMEVTGALAQWLHDHKNPKTGAPQPIQATFFVLGSCIKKTSLSSDGDKNIGCDPPTPNATAVLDKLVSLGHYVGNHTTTHRTLTEVIDDEPGDVPLELSQTDGLISKYLVWNRMFFRAPTGGWNQKVFNALKGTAMNKYVGPVYWNVGGGGNYPNVVTSQMAADWACWNGPDGAGTGKRYTTRQCGDRYITEIRAVENRGIVLMHDPYGDNFGNLDKVPGNTFDMVKYVIGEIEKDATPWTFKRLDEVPQIAAKLPKCDASCVQCSAAGADKCTACAADKHLDGGKCVDGGATGDAGTTDDAGTSSGDPTGSSTSSSSSSGGTSGKSSSGGKTGDDAGAEDGAAPPADDGGGGGCNTSGSDFGSSLGAAAIAVGLAISRRSKRRR